MAGLAIYSDDYEPRRLYASGDAAERERSLVEQAVRLGERPTTLLVAFEETGGRVVWTFRGTRGAQTNRTEYFLADYATDEGDLFEGFAAAMREDLEEWQLDRKGALRWNLDFELPHVAADESALGDTDIDHILEDLASDHDSPRSLEVDSLEAALPVLATIKQRGIACTVAIGAENGVASAPGVDLLITTHDPAPTRPPAREPTQERTDDGEPAEQPASIPTPLGGATFGIAAATLVVMLGFAAYSFVSVDPVHPITGLATVGGFIGTLAAIVIDSRVRNGHIALITSQALSNLEETLPLLAYGTLWAFLFPTVFRVGGRLLTGNTWLFGVVTSLGPAFLSAGLYVSVLTAMTALSIRVATTMGPEQRRQTFRRLAIGGAVYATALIIATGFAQYLWYRVIPAA